MSTTRESNHYLPAKAIPSVDESTPVGDVFQRLDREGRGAFLLTSKGRPARLVRTQRLWNELAEDVGELRRRGDDSAQLREQAELQLRLRRGGPAPAI